MQKLLYPGCQQHCAVVHGATPAKHPDRVLRGGTATVLVGPCETVRRAAFPQPVAGQEERVLLAVNSSEDLEVDRCLLRRPVSRRPIVSESIGALINYFTLTFQTQPPASAAFFLPAPPASPALGRPSHPPVPPSFAIATQSSLTPAP